MSTGQYDDLIIRAAAQYNITPRLLKLVMNLESGGNPTPKEAGQGAYGLFQIKPDTMEMMGYGRDPYNIEKAAFAAAKYLSLGIDQTGDALGAVGFYHSGSANRAAWGPNTNYHLQKAITQWNGAQVNDDPTNPDSYRPTPAGNSTSDVTASASSVRQGGNVTNKNTTRPRYTPAEIRADERFPPDAGSTPPAAPVDPDVAAGRKMMEDSLSDNPPAATPAPAPPPEKPVDPDIAAGRQMMQEVYDTPDPPPPPKPVTQLSPEQQLSMMGGGDTAGAGELGNLLTNPAFLRGVATPYRSGKELIARIGDFAGTTRNGSTYDPTYAEVHAQNKAEQEEFEKNHPDSQFAQGAGNFVGTTGALLAGGGLVGAAAKGIPYVAPAVRFMAGNSTGLATIPSAATGGIVANTAGNLLNSSESDAPLLDQAKSGWQTGAILGGVTGPVMRFLPGNRVMVDARNESTSPAFRADPFHPVVNDRAPSFMKDARDLGDDIGPETYNLLNNTEQPRGFFKAEYGPNGSGDGTTVVRTNFRDRHPYRPLPEDHPGAMFEPARAYREEEAQLTPAVSDHHVEDANPIVSEMDKQKVLANAKADLARTNPSLTDKGMAVVRTNLAPYIAGAGVGYLTNHFLGDTLTSAGIGGTVGHYLASLGSGATAAKLTDALARAYGPKTGAQLYQQYLDSLFLQPTNLLQAGPINAVEAGANTNVRLRQ